MRFLNPLDEHIETTLCLGLRCMPPFFRTGLCRPTSVGTENPEIKVDLSPRRWRSLFNRFQQQKIMLQHGYTPDIPDIYVLQQIIGYKIG